MFVCFEAACRQKTSPPTRTIGPFSSKSNPILILIVFHSAAAGQSQRGEEGRRCEVKTWDRERERSVQDGAVYSRNKCRNKWQ
jgi:hypothetical protein